MWKLILSLVGVVGLLAVADTVAISSASLPGDVPWLMMFTELLFVGAFGLIVGHKIVPKKWFFVGIGPILYYGGLCIIMQTPQFLWLDLRMLLATVSVMSGAYVGAGINCRTDKN